MLLGATGTGKSATTAWLIEQVQRPTLVMAPNKTLAAQLANEFRELLPNNAVEYFVSYYDYYQPEAYIPQTDTYIEKDSSINDEVERLRHSATNSLLTRRDVIVVASVSCIYGLGTPQEYVDRMARLRVGLRDRARRAAAPVRPDAVHPQRPRVHPRHVPGAGRHRRDHPGLRGARDPDRVLRRRDRADLHAAPADRRDRARGDRDVRLPGDPLRRRSGADGAGDPRHRARARGPAGGVREAGQAARGPAAADAHDLRHRDDAPGRLLLRHRELQPAHRRPRPGSAPNCLLDYFPEDFLLVIDESHVTVPQIGAMYEGRHVPQAQPRRLRLPAAQRDGQPPAAVGGVPRARSARRSTSPRRRASTSWPSPTASSSRSSARPAWSTPRSCSSRPRARSTTCSTRSASAPPRTSGSWSRR